MTAISTVQRTAKSEGVLDLANLSEIEVFMSRVFHKVETQQPSDVQIAQTAIDEMRDDVIPTEDFDALIAKASRAIEFLAARCEIMEQELAQRDEQVAEHEQAAKQWHLFAMKLQAQTANDQNIIADLTARCEALDSKVISLEVAAAEARERFAAANANSSKLQRHVVAAFGHKSPVHSVLQAISLQEAAE